MWRRWKPVPDLRHHCEVLWLSPVLKAQKAVTGPHNRGNKGDSAFFTPFHFANHFSNMFWREPGCAGRSCGHAVEATAWCSGAGLGFCPLFGFSEIQGPSLFSVSSSSLRSREKQFIQRHKARAWTQLHIYRKISICQGRIRKKSSFYMCSLFLENISFYSPCVVSLGSIWEF